MMKKSKDVAGKNGKSIVGILTNKAIMEKKPKPILPFDERVEIAKSIKYVDILHTGHINIIDVARKLDKITLGLLSDKERYLKITLNMF